jgi:hypothetical protein
VEGLGYLTVMKEIDAVLPAGAASGDRYPAAGMSAVNR